MPLLFGYVMVVGFVFAAYVLGRMIGFLDLFDATEEPADEPLPPGQDTCVVLGSAVTAAARNADRAEARRKNNLRDIEQLRDLAGKLRIAAGIATVAALAASTIAWIAPVVAATAAAAAVAAGIALGVAEERLNRARNRQPLLEELAEGAKDALSSARTAYQDAGCT
ncbi:MAG: hypothetical protein AAGA22_03400 [Pseudomonadota bacterium]